MKYTEIPNYVQMEIEDTCKPKKFMKIKDSKENPTFFAYHILGVTPYPYQYMFFDLIRKGKKRVIMCTGRQMGKSLSCAVISLWAAYYNTMPSGLHKNTKVIIVSKSENQAKKLLSEIKKLISLGDRNFGIRTAGRMVDIMSKELADDQPQTASQITFKNGGYIKSLAPTDSARGDTADLLLLDEAAFIDEDLYYNALEPMTSHVNGTIVMASTPNGVSGMFYKIFDPYDERDNNPFVRLWFNYTYVTDGIQKTLIDDRKEQWIKEGKMANFQQEYEAMFTVSEANFFDATKVDLAVDNDLVEMSELKHEPCCLGLDYGWKSSKTVIIITSKGKDDIVRVRFIHGYQTDGSDVNLIEDIENLMKRFKIQTIVSDDCSMGYLTNQKMMNKGWPVMPYNFRTDQNAGERNRGYYMLRAKMYEGKVKILKHFNLIKELKQLLEIKKAVNVTIKAPSNEHEDFADALCMSCYPFIANIENTGDLAALVGPPSVGKTNDTNYRKDTQWDLISGNT